jgi:type IV fimbrial biogenesis protein FimT
MNPSRCRRRAPGFTIIELMVAVAVLAVLAVIAAPSFTEYLAKRRVNGLASELVTDLQFARSEAVSRNENVRITFGTDCYVIHRAAIGGTATVASCDRSSKTVAPPAAEIKTVQLEVGQPLTIVPAVEFFEFEPVRGTAENDLAATGTVDVYNTTGREWRLRAVMTLMGRVATCSPAGAGYFSGYSSVCS